MIEIFKTDVQHEQQAVEVVALLLQHFPKSRINFDLEDCDKILRVEGKDFVPENVMLLVNRSGFHCHILE